MKIERDRFPSLINAVSYMTERHVDDGVLTRLIDSLTFVNVATEVTESARIGITRFLHAALSGSEELTDEWLKSQVDSEQIIMGELADRMVDRFKDLSIYYRALLLDIYQYSSCTSIRQRVLLEVDESTSSVDMALSGNQVLEVVYGNSPFVLLPTGLVDFLDSSNWRSLVGLDESDRSGFITLAKELELRSVSVLIIPDEEDA